MRLRLDLAYDGTDFAGWARQPGLRTVAGELEAALGRLVRLAAPPSTVVAGRTDAGVHARGQVVHVDVPADAWVALPGRSARTPEEALLRALAAVLPADVRVHAVSVAPDGFDARFSALARSYAYHLTDAVAGPEPLRRRDVVGVRGGPAGRLDEAAMDEASRALEGLHDFAAFCRPRQGATTIRTLRRYRWRRHGDLVTAEVVADAFCHSMVRALVGCVTAVGQGRRDVAWPAAVLAAGRRTGDVQVAPARGLVLEHVAYPPAALLAERARTARARRDAPQPPWQPRTMTETPRASDAGRFDSRASDDELEVRDVTAEPTEHDGVMEMADREDDRVADAEWDRGMSPAEKPSYLLRHGMSAQEEIDGETIDERLRQEEPDVPVGSGGAYGAGSGELGADEPDDGELLDDQVGYTRAGRLVAPDTGSDTDTEKDEIATDVGYDGGAASAEEAAMHVVGDEGDDEDSSLL